MAQIILLVVLLVIIIIATPAKVRPFIAFISIIAGSVLSFYIIQSSGKNGVIVIPEIEGQPGFELSIEDFTKLTSAKASQSGLVKISNIETLLEKNKGILTYDDLSLLQKEELKTHALYQGLREGKMGILIRTVEPYIENGVPIEGYQAIEVIDYKAFYELNKKEGIIDRKNKVLEEINNLLGPERNELN